MRDYSELKPLAVIPTYIFIYIYHKCLKFRYLQNINRRIKKILIFKTSILHGIYTYFYHLWCSSYGFRIGEYSVCTIAGLHSSYTITRRFISRPAIMENFEFLDVFITQESFELCYSIAIRNLFLVISNTERNRTS